MSRNDDNKNKAKETISNMLQKASEIAKKTVSDVQTGVANLSKKNQKAYQEKRMEKLRPLFAKEFKNKNFKIPNVIQIVDDAVRRNIDLCEGAIGWLEDHKGVEVLHLYDEFMHKCGINFVPTAQCDSIYCVDAFDRNQFVNTNYIFSKTNEEKLAELANIAHSLGAKSCSIEMLEAQSNSATKAFSVNTKVPELQTKSSTQYSNTTENAVKSRGKRVLKFVGNNVPTRPTLKWFAHDENIKGLIEMRCTDNNSIQSTILELSGSNHVTMSRKVAAAIDSIGVVKFSSTGALEQQAIKEHSSRLLFEIEF